MSKKKSKDNVERMALEQSITQKTRDKILRAGFFEELDQNKLRLSMEAFRRLNGVDIELTDLRGKILIETTGENLCRQFHRGHPELGSHCFLSKEEKILDYRGEGKKLLDLANVKYEIYKCKNHIPYSISPVFINEQHVANLTVRNFFIKDFLEPYDLIKQGKEAGFDEESYIKMMRSYPVYTPEEFNDMMEYLSYISGLLGEMAYGKKTDEILKKELMGAYEELNASYEELTAIEEELRDQIRVIQEKDQKIIAQEEEYRRLYEKMSEGLAIHEMMYDAKGEPKDYQFLKVNKAFEKLTGLKREEILGKTVLEVLPNTEEYWIKEYGKVTKENKLVEVENYSKELDRFYNVKAYKVGKNSFATLITDVTERRRIEQRRKRGWFQTVASLGEIVERRDAYTSGHQKNVAIIARQIGERLGLDEDRLEGLYLAGLLHDIGKIQIPSEILTKPTKLLPQEFELIKLHPESGYDLLKNIDFPWNISNFVLQHHEKIDGSGYPRGLKGDEILLEARILSVTDVVEAISSHRPYRPALGLEFALEEIKKYRGSKFDSDVVDAFMELQRENALPTSMLER